jgi:hypothetical protein
MTAPNHAPTAPNLPVHPGQNPQEVEPFAPAVPTVEFLHTDGSPYLPEAPVSPAGPGMPLTEEEMAALQLFADRYRSGEYADARELTVGDQALALHAEIYGSQNGVPSVDAFRSAREFAENMHFQPDVYSVTQSGEVVQGAYFTAEGEQLPPDIASDIIDAAHPERWVQSASNRDVLARARDVLGNDQIDVATELPTLTLAEGLAGRVVDDPDAVDAPALQRMIDLDLEARRQLRQAGKVRAEDGSTMSAKEYIEHVADVNGYKDAVMNPTPAIGGRVEVPEAAASRFANDESQDRLVRPEDMAIDPRNAGATAPVRGADGRRAEYAAAGGENRTDGAILEELIANGEIRNAEDIAAWLYPHKMIGGSSQYGAASVRGRNGILQVGETAPRRYSEALDPAELAEVEGFAGKLAIARGLEDGVANRFKNRLPELGFNEVAEALFPGVMHDDLTYDQLSAVSATTARLSAARLEQVHHDRLLPVRMRWERIKQAAGSAWGKAQNFAEGAKNAAVDAKAKFDQARTAAPDYLKDKWAQAQAVGENAREAARPENMKALLSMGIGALAVQGARMRQERPWEQPMINAAWRTGQRLRRMRDFVLKIEVGAGFREVGVQLYMLAQNARGRMMNYVSQRLEAVKNMDRGQRNYNIMATATVLAMAGAFAVKAYMQYRHGVAGSGSAANMGSETLNDPSLLDTDNSTSGMGSADQLNDTDAGSNTDAPGPDSTKAERPRNVNDTVEVGAYDSGRKIQGYPQGTVGYRALEHAQAQGFTITDRDTADRIIGETLKANKLGWNSGVSADQKLKMLSADQVEALLKR